MQGGRYIKISNLKKTVLEKHEIRKKKYFLKKISSVNLGGIESA
jgi:hypothetical protein